MRGILKVACFQIEIHIKKVTALAILMKICSDIQASGPITKLLVNCSMVTVMCNTNIIDVSLEAYHIKG